MKRILKGQSIRVEAHQRGDGRQVRPSRGLHIHKVLDNDHHSGAEFLVPLTRDQDIEVRKVKGENERVKRKILNEIKKEFRSSKKRTEFVRFVLDKVEMYGQEMKPPEKIRLLVIAAEEIAHHFELKPADTNEVLSDASGRVIQIVSSGSDPDDGESYHILQDVEGKSIKIGKDLQILRDWEKVRTTFLE